MNSGHSSEVAAAGPGGRRFGAILMVAVLAQLLLVAAALRPEPRRLVGDEMRYHEQGLRLAAGEELPAEPLWPPLQRRLLGIVFETVGESLAPVFLLQAAFFLGSAILLRRLLGRMPVSPLAADLAVGLYLFDPGVAGWTVTLWPESVHLLLALGGVTLLLARAPLAAVVAGLLLGLALAAKSFLLPFVPLAMVAAAVARPADSPRRDLSLRPVLLLAGLLAVLLPMALARPGAGLGGSAAVNLRAGLLDPADPRVTAATSVVAAFEASPLPPGSKSAALLQASLGTVARRGVGETLLGQLRKLPRRLLGHDPRHLDLLLGSAGPSDSGPGPLRRAAGRLAAIPWGATLLLASIGLVGVPKGRCPRAFALTAAFLGGSTILFLALHAILRYRAAMAPAFAVFAALGIGALLAPAPPVAAAGRFPGLRAGVAAGTLLLLLAGLFPGAGRPAARADAPPLDDADCRVRWLSIDVPATARPGDLVPVTVRLANAGGATWPDPVAASASLDGNRAVRLSWGWREEEDGAPPFAAPRIDLDGPLPPGGETTLEFDVVAPPGSGRRTLELELVEEGVGWFSARGGSPLRVAIELAGDEAPAPR